VASHSAADRPTMALVPNTHGIPASHTRSDTAIEPRKQGSSGSKPLHHHVRTAKRTN